jgi:hypothetical protein
MFWLYNYLFIYLFIYCSFNGTANISHSVAFSGGTTAEQRISKDVDGIPGFRGGTKENCGKFKSG